MKKFFLYVFAATAILSSCSEDEDNQPKDIIKVLTFDEASWNSKIDNPQYYGPLLYSDSPLYAWSDAETQLSHASYGEHSIWEGIDYGYFPYYFEAVSNYCSTDLAKSGDSNSQLTVCNTKAHSGSNFCVHYGYGYPCGGFSFPEGVSGTIASMYVCSTTYMVNVLLNGNDYCPAATDTDEVWIVAYGKDAKTGTVKESKFYLLEKGKKVINDWTEWDLSSLGEISSIQFDIQATAGGLSGEWGLNVPAYFAFDDVTVVFKP